MQAFGHINVLLKTFPWLQELLVHSFWHGATARSSLSLAMLLIPYYLQFLQICFKYKALDTVPSTGAQ